MAYSTREHRRLIGYRPECNCDWLESIEKTAVQPLIPLVMFFLFGGGLPAEWFGIPIWLSIILCWLIAAILATMVYRMVVNYRQKLIHDYTTEEMFRTAALIRSSETGSWEPMRWVPLHTNVLILFDDNKDGVPICIASVSGARVHCKHSRCANLGNHCGKPLCWTYLQSGRAIGLPSAEVLERVEGLQND